MRDGGQTVARNEFKDAVRAERIASLSQNRKGEGKFRLIGAKLGGGEEREIGRKGRRKAVERLNGTNGKKEGRRTAQVTRMR